MGIQLKIMKISGMIDRINKKIENLKANLEGERIATEIEILSQHRDRLIVAVSNLKSQIGVY